MIYLYFQLVNVFFAYVFHKFMSYILFIIRFNCFLMFDVKTYSHKFVMFYGHFPLPKVNLLNTFGGTQFLEKNDHNVEFKSLTPT